MVRALVVTAALFAGAGASSAATPATKYAVSYTATLTAALTSDACPGAAYTTLQATIASTTPITATLSAGRLTFSPSPGRSAQPLEATVNVTIAACGGSAARTCGPVTATLVPGLEQLEVSGSTLKSSLDSNGKVFPDSDSCSSGLIEVFGMTAPINLSRLAGSPSTTVNGTWSSSRANATRSVEFHVRFTRKP